VGLSSIELLPILTILRGVAPIVMDYVSRLADEDASALPSKDKLAGDLAVALMALPSPKAYGKELVDDQDRMALAAFLAGVVLNMVRAKKGLIPVEPGDSCTV